MVDEMTPEVIYQTVQTTPRPATALPQCAEDLLTELGNEELFRRILAVGYMSYQAFEKNRKKRLGETYKPNTIREVAARFNISTSRADGFASGCCHKQRRYTEGEDVEG